MHLKHFPRYFLLLLLLCFISTKTLADKPALQILQAHVMAAPPGVSVTAGFLILQNTTDTDIIISAVSSDVFADIEIHLTEINNGVATMIPQSQLTVPANSRVDFDASGYHLMLYEPKQGLSLDESVHLTAITSVGTLTINAIVKSHDTRLH